MTTGQPPAGLYSPDGRYRWDGSAWQPAEQAPAAQPQAPPPWGAPAPHGSVPSPPWGAPAPQGSAPHGAPPRQGPRTVLIVGLAAIVALVVGVTAGWIGGTARSLAGGPTQPPSIPEEFPGDRQRYLEGVTVARVTQEWQDTGPSWTCEAAEPPPSGAAQTTRCTVGADAGHAFTLNVEHDDDAQIWQMNLSCRARADSEPCRSIFAWLAETTLSGAPEQQAARDWAAANAASDLSAAFGRVYLEVRLEPNTLFVAPVP